MGSKEDMNAYIQALLSTNVVNNNDRLDESTFFSDSIFDEITVPLELSQKEELDDNSLLGRNTIGFYNDEQFNTNDINQKPIICRSQSYNSFFKTKNLIDIVSWQEKPKKNKMLKKVLQNQQKIIESIENINKILIHLHERIDSIDVCVNKSFYAT